MPWAETSSPSFGRALSDVGNARLMTTSKPACRNAAKSSGCGMPLVASRSSRHRKLRMWVKVLMLKSQLGFLRRAKRHHAHQLPRSFLLPNAPRVLSKRIHDLLHLLVVIFLIDQPLIVKCLHF